ncbi:hypothetical protein ACLOJK_040771 [Asimina triloba]
MRACFHTSLDLSHGADGSWPLLSAPHARFSPLGPRRCSCWICLQLIVRPNHGRWVFGAAMAAPRRLAQISPDLAPPARISPPSSSTVGSRELAAVATTSCLAGRRWVLGQPWLPYVWVMEHHILVLRWSMGRSVPAMCN